MKRQGMLDVRTAEETPLAVWIEGEGPPIVLVHGSMCDHTTFDPLIAELGRDFTVFAMDRRGFGASPESGEYTSEREFGDVARVVDAAVGYAGCPVALFGHSWGASCAMGGAVRTANIQRLVLYEPSLGLKYPPGFIAGIETKVAAGDAAGAILSVLVDLAGMTDEQVEAMRSSPTWPERLATAPTIAREARIEDSWVIQPGQFDAITAPTLFLVGGESPPDMVEITRRRAAAIADTRVHTLAGHGHFAYKTHPSEVADAIRRFIRAPS